MKECWLTKHTKYSNFNKSDQDEGIWECLSAPVDVNP